MPVEAEKETLYHKIDALNQQAWQARIVHYDQAHDLSVQAIDLAGSINYTKGIAEGLRTLGFSYIRKGKHLDALPHLNESLRLFQLLNNLHGQSDVYEYLGIVQRSLNDYGGSLAFLYKSLELREQLDYQEGKSLSHYQLGVTYKYLGNYDKALEHLLKSLTICRSIPFEFLESYALNLIGQVYFETGMYPDALDYFQQSLVIRQREEGKLGEAGSLDNIGFISFKMGDYEKAIEYCSRALVISEIIDDKKGQGNALFHLAAIYQHLDQYEKALECCKQSLEIRHQMGDKKGEAEALLFLAEVQAADLQEQQSRAHIIELLDKALQLGQDIKALDILAKIHFAFYRIRKQFHQHEQALHHLEIYLDVDKELNSNAVKQKILDLEIAHRAEQSRKETELFRLRNVELSNLYEESKKQKEEIELQKIRLEQSLTQLKETHTQLIQKEKMASLGELTAGIAHEIQNPLNFINNFSDLTIELLDEMQHEIAAENKEAVTEIIRHVNENLEKICHHGKRADAIVKSMLEHSRTSKGEKQPTDINALADEYLRLAYHGMRAKDKSFNVVLETQFDEKMGKINVIPQDIGRVLRNLFNNAFYSVHTKKKELNGVYEPVVSVQTKGYDEKIEIRVKDNGLGIAQNIVDKIFQPFFTTKPTGEGTGLGLSLSYDIITKGHGGELKVETKEEGAEFIVQLPVA